MAGQAVYIGLMANRQPLQTERMALFDRIAQRRGISSQAIRRATESNDGLDAFIQVCVDVLDRSDGIPHEPAMAGLDAMIAKRRLDADNPVAVGAG